MNFNRCDMKNYQKVAQRFILYIFFLYILWVGVSKTGGEDELNGISYWTVLVNDRNLKINSLRNYKRKL